MALFMTASVSAAGLQLTEPDGGENLPLGLPFTITWTSSGISAQLRLVLFRNGAHVGVIADNLSATATSYGWTVGAFAGGTASAGGGYQVRVRTVDGTAFDDSDGFFAISPGSFSLTAPNGGESWPLGSNRLITWTVGGVTGSVRLDLYKNGTAIENKVGTIMSSTGAAVGKYSWKVGDLINAQAPDGGGYRIVISSYAPQLKDSSDGPFTIAPAQLKLTSLPSPGLSLTNPRRADRWYKGTGYTITWTFHGLEEFPVRLDLMRNDGTTVVEKIAKNIANNGQCFWSVPLSLPDAETLYKMRIRTMDGKHSDTAGPFKIAKAKAPAGPPYVQVIAPVGPAQVGTGIVYPIRWKSTCGTSTAGPTDDGFDIHLMNAAGTTKITQLHGGTAVYDGGNPDGSHSWHWDWHIPQNEKAGTYRISVTNWSGRCTGIGEPFQLVYQQDFKEYVLKPAVYANCYHVFLDQWTLPGHWSNPFTHFVDPKLGGNPNLARVGFAWIWHMLNDKQTITLQAVFRSMVRFGGDLWYKEKGYPLTAKLILKRKHGMADWYASYGPAHYPVLGGAVLMDKAVICPRGDANLYVPLASIGSAVPAVPGRGNSWEIDLSQSYRVLAQGSKPDHGVLLYSSVDSNPGCGGACRYFNVEFYEVTLTIRFAKDIDG